MNEVNRSPWYRKRRLSAKMERIRAGKFSKSCADSTPSTSHGVAPLQAGTDVPTNEQPLEEAAGTHSSNEPGSSEHESRITSFDESFSLPIDNHVSDVDLSSSSDEEYISDFTLDDAQQVYRDWISEQPKETVKTLSVMMMDTFMNRFGLTVVAAASECGLIFGPNEKTIRRWRNDFYGNQGDFTASKQGKHSRPFVLNDENCRREASKWVRCNASVKGEPNMTAAKFRDWVNSSLLPNADLPPGLPRQIQERTAVKWLHELGFRPQAHKKGIYIDGHERSDVVEYRKLYLRKLEILQSTHLPPPLCSDGLMVTHRLGVSSATKKLVLIYHDESSFHANDGQSIIWAEEGKVPIRPKTQGRGLMVSDFVTEYDGLLKLSDEEFESARKTIPLISKEAREILRFGAANEGYWTNEKFLDQIKKVIPIAKVKFPKESHTLVWLFDQSSGHCAYTDDALNVKRMNVKPGGAQPWMRNTTWNGKTQTMVLPDGRPKGMKLVLKERGINTKKMKAADMALVLGNHHDFKYEKTAIEHLMKGHGFYCFFIPKFHCELNPIERVWGEAKRYTRAHCDYSFAGLEKTINPALDSVSTDLIRKFFRKVREYMQAYQEGFQGGAEVEIALKRYKSHRRVFDSA